MNILFLCHQLTGGGAERVCADVANGLSRLGHKVAIMMDTSIAIVYPVLQMCKFILVQKERVIPGSCIVSKYFGRYWKF